MVARTWSSRAAANSSVSAKGPSGLAAPDNSTWRMISAPADPPGSRVTTTAMACERRRRANSSAWVDFPAPSPPSKVMKRPRISPCLVACAPLYPFAAGTEQPNDQFARRIEGAARQAALFHAFGGLERNFEHHVVTAPYPQGRDRLAFLDRRADRAAVDDSRHDLVVRAPRHQQVDGAGGHQGNAGLGAAEQPGVADILALGEQEARLEAFESPFEQPLALVGAIIRALQAVDDDDQAQAVLRRGADQPIAAAFGKSGLQAVGADIHGEQRIAVQLADLVPGELLLAVHRIELRIGLDDVLREAGELARRDDQPRVGQARRVGEIRLGEAELARPLGHHLGEFGLRPGNTFGERH